jgi:hypothetical protein
MRKLLFAAILAVSGVMAMAVSAGAGTIPPCC